MQSSVAKTVLLCNLLNIVFAIVDRSKNCGNSFGNTLKLGVGQFPFHVEIRQVSIDHLDGGDIIHLKTVLLGKVINELWEYRAMGSISAHCKEIIGLER